MLIYCIEKLALELDYGSLSSKSKHVCLKVSFKIFIPCQVDHLIVIEKGELSKTKGFKVTCFAVTALSNNFLCL